jgi:hypothetical protein
MANVRNVSGEARHVAELNYRLIGPDEVVEVPDDRLEGYTCQESTWVEVKGED